LPEIVDATSQKCTVEQSERQRLEHEIVLVADCQRTQSIIRQADICRTIKYLSSAGKCGTVAEIELRGQFEECLITIA
jgi:hypothetical protein